MNKIPCVILDCSSDGGALFVKLDFQGHTLRAMLLEGGHILCARQKVNALFKETEVMVCAADYSQISARNRFVSKVAKTEVSSVLARVVFDFEGLQIASLISSEAYTELRIEVGKVFGWFVKSSEVMLEYV